MADFTGWQEGNSERVVRIDTEVVTEPMAYVDIKPAPKRLNQRDPLLPLWAARLAVCACVISAAAGAWLHFYR